ncbi:MAG: ribonuclease HI family protein [candidate division WOR-3 bacterium]
MADRLRVYIDGSSLGNPGPAGAGVLIENASGETVCKLSVPLGDLTNNQAEYMALIEALRWLLRNRPEDEAEIITDSRLLCEQMRGAYRLRDPEIARLAESARALCARLRVSFRLVEREQNRRSDLLARRAARTARKEK